MRTYSLSGRLRVAWGVLRGAQQRAAAERQTDLVNRIGEVRADVADLVRQVEALDRQRGSAEPRDDA